MPLIRKNGQLVDVSPEEAAKLQQKSGSSPQQTSPNGIAGDGGTPQQAAMAGTPNQKQGAATINMGATETLSGTQRVDTGRKTATAGEEEASSQVGRIEQLGNLGSRVEGLVADQRTQAANSTALEERKQFVGDNAEEINKHINDLQNPATADDAISALLDGGYGFTQAMIDEYMPSTDAADIGKTAAESMMDYEQVNLGSLDPLQLGIEESELVDLLGPEWQNMSLADFQNKITELETQEYSKIDGLQAELANRMTSPARKEAILDELRDLGHVGVGSTEAAMEDLDLAIQESDIVDGQSLEELLSDENISQDIKEFLTAEEGSNEYNEFMESNPELAAWAIENKEAMTAAAEQLEATKLGYDERVQENKDFITEHGLNEAAVEVLGIKGGTAFDKEAVAGFTKALGEYKETFGPQFNELAELNPELAKELIAMGGDIDDMVSDPRWNDYIGDVIQVSKINNLGDDATAKEVMDAIFGDEFKYDEAQGTLDDLVKEADAGDPFAKDRLAVYRSILDADGDGDVDDASAIAATAKKKTKTPNKTSNELNPKMKQYTGVEGFENVVKRNETAKEIATFGPDYLTGIKASLEAETDPVKLGTLERYRIYYQRLQDNANKPKLEPEPLREVGTVNSLVSEGLNGNRLVDDPNFDKVR